MNDSQKRPNCLSHTLEILFRLHLIEDCNVKMKWSCHSKVLNQNYCLQPCLANDESSLHFHFERDRHCLVCSLMETLWRRATDQKKLLSGLEESMRDHEDFLELAAKEKYFLFWKLNPLSLKLVFKLLSYHWKLIFKPIWAANVE